MSTPPLFQKSPETGTVGSNAADVNWTEAAPALGAWVMILPTVVVPPTTKSVPAVAAVNAPVPLPLNTPVKVVAPVPP